MHLDPAPQPGVARSDSTFEKTESEVLLMTTEARSNLWTLIEKSDKQPSKWSPLLSVVVVEPRTSVVTVSVSGRGWLAVARPESTDICGH